MKASSFPRNFHQRIRSSLAAFSLLAVFVARCFRCSCLFVAGGFSLLTVFSLPVSFFAGSFVGGPKWTRTTDLTIISRAL